MVRSGIHPQCHSTGLKKGSDCFLSSWTVTNTDGLHITISLVLFLRFSSSQSSSIKVGSTGAELRPHENSRQRLPESCVLKGDEESPLRAHLMWPLITFPECPLEEFYETCFPRCRTSEIFLWTSVMTELLHHLYRYKRWLRWKNTV